MIRELEEVALTVDIQEYHLKTGDIGVVVDITPNGKQVTLEFFTLDGATFAVVPVAIESIRRMGNHEIANARVIA